MPNSSPLTDVRVLDLSRLLPGPYCSRILTGTTVRSDPPVSTPTAGQPTPR